MRGLFEAFIPVAIVMGAVGASMPTKAATLSFGLDTTLTDTGNYFAEYDFVGLTPPGGNTSTTGSVSNTGFTSKLFLGEFFDGTTRYLTGKIQNTSSVGGEITGFGVFTNPAAELSQYFVGPAVNNFDDKWSWQIGPKGGTSITGGTPLDNTKLAFWAGTEGAPGANGLPTPANGGLNPYLFRVAISQSLQPQLGANTIGLLRAQSIGVSGSGSDKIYTPQVNCTGDSCGGGSEVVPIETDLPGVLAISALGYFAYRRRRLSQKLHLEA